MSISGGAKHHDQPINKVSVIGGGDLGMATVMGILSKVISFLILLISYSLIFLHYMSRVLIAIVLFDQLALKHQMLI